MSDAKSPHPERATLLGERYAANLQLLHRTLAASSFADRYALFGGLLLGLARGGWPLPGGLDKRPAHNINGQTIRTVNWTVYMDGDHEVRRASGYLIGTSSYTLVNPVSITRMNAGGGVVAEIQAVRGSGVENSGQLTTADSLPQSSWTR